MEKFDIFSQMTFRLFFMNPIFLKLVLMQISSFTFISSSHAHKTTDNNNNNNNRI